jgi:hypothetical protein
MVAVAGARLDDRRRRIELSDTGFRTFGFFGKFRFAMLRFPLDIFKFQVTSAVKFNLAGGPGRLSTAQPPATVVSGWNLTVMSS